MRSLVLALLSLLLAATPAAGEITGKRPLVVDGKTLQFAGARIRLFGIDAPDYEPMTYYSSDDEEQNPAEFLASLHGSYEGGTVG